MKSVLRLGTRGSRLALYQEEFVRGKILRSFSLERVERVIIKTSGDMIRRHKPSLVETKRIFTREIEAALLSGEIDAAVHSAKDLAVNMPEGLEIGAVLDREDPRDCLISRVPGQKLTELPTGARVGTGSPRRKRQLLKLRGDLTVEDIHGNVETRIRKLDQGSLDALVLAYAGIRRLGLENRISEIFPEEIFYPAPGQGVIVVQTRVNDPDVQEVLRTIHDRPSGVRLESERAFLASLQGGCQLPCGISTAIEGELLKVSGAIFAMDSSLWTEAQTQGSCQEAAETGRRLARMILEKGGQKILDDIHARYGHSQNHESS